MFKKTKVLARQFFTLMKAAGQQALKNDLLVLAGSLTFTSILSIAPLIAVIFWIFHLAGGFYFAYEKLLPYMLSILSEGSGEAAQEHLKKFIDQVHANAMGGVGLISLFITFFSTYISVIQSFARILENEKKLSFGKNIQNGAIVLIIGPILFLASILVTALLSSQLVSLPFSGRFFAIFLNTLLYAIVYKLMAFKQLPFRIVFVGSIFPAILLEAAKLGYALYTTKVVSYSKFYGSLAAVPLFLLWIYILWCITLFGVAWMEQVETAQKEKNENRR